MPEKGFFGSLFDLSFTSLITTKVIKFIYVITLILVTIATLGLIFTAFHIATVFGVFALVILGPLYWLFLVIYSRIILEFFIALFRVMETNVELVALKRQQMGLAGSGSVGGSSTGTSGWAAPEAQPATVPTYKVGDVVNGHRFDGTRWVPVDEA